MAAKAASAAQKPQLNLILKCYFTLRGINIILSGHFLPRLPSDFLSQHLHSRLWRSRL